MNGATARRREVADGLAIAFLAGPWRRQSMLSRARRALGVDRSPQWLLALTDQVLAAYDEAPVDAARELAAHLQVCPAWAAAWRERRTPRIVTWTPTPTASGPRPWPVADLPDLSALAALLGVDQAELAWFADVRSIERDAAEPLRHYRWRMMPKPGGEIRVVAAPKPRLKEIQRRLLRHVLGPIPAHAAAHGCVPGRSVRSALEPHAGAAVVIRVDLASFFASVTAGRVWGLLREAGLPEAVAHAVTGLLTTVAPRHVRRVVAPAERRRLAHPHLPAGAPTSPAVANLIVHRLDRRVAGLAARFGATYTRYVDDLILSGGPALRPAAHRLVARIATLAEAEGFALNARKTVVLGSAGRQSVLGAVVNIRPTLPRHERDALRAILHNCATLGWRSQVRDHEDLRAHLLGRVSWASGLDPVLGARLRARFEEIDWT